MTPVWPGYVAVPDEALYRAFCEHPSTGQFILDAQRYAAFQAGWHAALDWVNAHAVDTPAPDKTEGAVTPSEAIAVLEALRPRVGLDVSVGEQYAAVNVAIEALRKELR